MRYPRVHTRGPIEAQRAKTGVLKRPNYPRVHTRGPIEAVSSSDRPGGIGLAIRGFTPAAPLKRETPEPRRGSGRCYPRVHTRGPIEALAAKPVVPLPPNYPRVHTRGPIEAAER